MTLKQRISAFACLVAMGERALGAQTASSASSSSSTSSSSSSTAPSRAPSASPLTAAASPNLDAPASTSTTATTSTTTATATASTSWEGPAPVATHSTHSTHDTELPSLGSLHAFQSFLWNIPAALGPDIDVADQLHTDNDSPTAAPPASARRSALSPSARDSTDEDEDEDAEFVADNDNDNDNDDNDDIIEDSVDGGEGDGSDGGDGGDGGDADTDGGAGSATRRRRSRGNQHKSSWSAAEDAALIRLAEAAGHRQWRIVAEKLAAELGVPPRTGRQCRERFVHHLDPKLVKQPWRPEEELRLIELVGSLGPRWSLVAAHLPGRCDNNCKNRYNALTKRVPGRRKRGKAGAGGDGESGARSRKRPRGARHDGAAVEQGAAIRGPIAEEQQPVEPSSAAQDGTESLADEMGDLLAIVNAFIAESADGRETPAEWSVPAGVLTAGPRGGGVGAVHV